MDGGGGAVLELSDSLSHFLMKGKNTLFSIKL